MGFFERVLGGFAMGHHGGRYGGGGHGRRGYQEYGNPADDLPRRPVAAADGPVCGKCGGANAAAARFCGQCGTAVRAETCAGCSADLTPGAKFCGQCGRPQ